MYVQEKGGRVSGMERLQRSLQPVWMVFRREGGECACGRAHACPLRQLLQTAVERLSGVFVLPNNYKAWCGSPETERQRRLQERRLREAISEAGAGGRRMPPSDFCGTL